jgi:hypothetical protein
MKKQLPGLIQRQFESGTANAAAQAVPVVVHRSIISFLFRFDPSKGGQQKNRAPVQKLRAAQG